MKNLDQTDRKLLRLLQQDCRITIKELSKKLYLSNTPVYERIKKLEKRGIIKGYVALLEPEVLDRSMVVFISLSMENHSRDAVEKFKNEVMVLTEVMEFYYTSGNYDALIKLMVKDMNAYSIFVQEKLSKIDIVSRFNSTFIISSSVKTVFDI
ncbi:Lrp/AsnC family transcriptional regulator [Carboxylicivirga sp. N1Y90]|uniref:Lrp/AsnC family transcriptional regulator n=1 Tax=Carboxylicivirga fragile TaxID=3417571 RepID=UPI003D350285|nr:Lrp/AsnC family transcriptional regulator [Marinilabiliaceae bacterium N1Y90]